MGTTVENIKIKKLRHVTKTVADKKVFSKSEKSDELLLLFQCVDDVFKGWEFFENEIYEGVFIQNE